MNHELWGALALDAAVLVTIGLAVVLRSVVLLIWGASPHKLDVGAADAVLRFDDIGIRTSQIGVVLVLLASLAGMWAFFQRSRFGVAMRAVAATTSSHGVASPSA